MKTFTSKSTKQEILAAYHELEGELKAAKQKRPAAATDDAPASASSTAAPQESATVTFDDLARDLDSIRTRFGDAAGALQQQLVREAGRLEDLRAEIAAYNEHLKALHGIEVGDDTLRELVRRYLETQRTADEAHVARKRKLEEELEGRKAAWRKQQEEHARTSEEAASAAKLSRARDQEEYTYGTERARKADADALAQDKKRLQGELDALSEERNRAWAEREKDVARREQEYAELKAKSTTFPKDLEAAVARAEAEGTAIAKRQAKIASDLAQKDFEGKKKVFDLRAHELDATIKKQDEQIAELSKQLATALKQAQDLAMKAIDGASNTTSFQAVKEIALEQAKTSQKFK